MQQPHLAQIMLAIEKQRTVYHKLKYIYIIFFIVLPFSYIPFDQKYFSTKEMNSKK